MLPYRLPTKGTVSAHFSTSQTLKEPFQGYFCVMWCYYTTRRYIRNIVRKQDSCIQSCPGWWVSHAPSPSTYKKVVYKCVTRTAGSRFIRRRYLSFFVTGRTVRPPLARVLVEGLTHSCATILSVAQIVANVFGISMGKKGNQGLSWLETFPTQQEP